MTEAKHTTGVWEKGWGSGLSGPRVAPTVYLDVVGCAQIPIRSGSAAVAWILCDKKDVHANADASLIAAAPELLAALQACLEKGKRWHPCDPIVLKARAAIAKATGN